MNIHIVHLPHTFPYLLEFSLAFKKYGFDTVTLVANGFNLEEIKQLKKSVSCFTFIEILDIPTKRILSHGQALNFAFEHSQDELFCFADHDIFPTQNLRQDIQLSLQEYDVVCLGDRPENTQTVYKGFAASATESQSGVPLATSFFSIFKRKVIEQAKLHFNVGFEQYFRKSQLPRSLTDQSDIKSLQEPFLIDTCKVLSLAFYELGYNVKYLNTDKVCHYGGLAGAINRYINNNKSLKSEFIAPHLPGNQELENHYKTYQKRHPKVLELKRCISDYALQLIIALQEETSLPSFKTDNDELKKSVDKIKLATQKLFISGF
ncbi:MAG: hypothetical protein ACK5L8_03475 [Marinicella pacifica]